MDWRTGEGLIGCDEPDEVDMAFDRGEPYVGVAVIGLALNVLDVDVVAPRAIRALSSDARETRGQGLTALSHMARLNGKVDAVSVEMLRALLKDPEYREIAANYATDIWIYVPHRDVPMWLRWWSYKFVIRHRLAIWWWSIHRRG
ncbi:hypothetical protein [Nonomuraea sp. NPDC049480]|uniref:hypothetical protein n=1 Tax=Nonomuraea sp. NPDC049480 TaxID=3364353 RepID=UPI0037BB1C6B